MADIANHISVQVPAFKQVGTAAAFAAAMEGRRTLPAAFVLPARESAQENPFMGQAVEQQVSAEFVVMLAARDVSDAKGGASVDSLEPMRETLRDALLNWVPPGTEAGCEFSGGEMFQMDADGVLWWADTFRTTFPIRSV